MQTICWQFISFSVMGNIQANMNFMGIFFLNLVTFAWRNTVNVIKPIKSRT